MARTNKELDYHQKLMEYNYTVIMWQNIRTVPTTFFLIKQFLSCYYSQNSILCLQLLHRWFTHVVMMLYLQKTPGFNLTDISNDDDFMFIIHSSGKLLAKIYNHQILLLLPRTTEMVGVVYLYTSFAG